MKNITLKYVSILLAIMFITILPPKVNGESYQLSGYLNDKEGNPIPMAEIYIWGIQYNHTSALGGHVITNSSGYFSQDIIVDEYDPNGEIGFDSKERIMLSFTNDTHHVCELSFINVSQPQLFDLVAERYTARLDVSLLTENFTVGIDNHTWITGYVFDNITYDGLIDREITLIFNGSEYTTISQLGGLFSFEIDLPNEVGQYPISIRYNDTLMEQINITMVEPAKPINYLLVLPIVIVFMGILGIFAYKKRVNNTKSAPSRGLDEGQGPAQERKGGEN